MLEKEQQIQIGIFLTINLYDTWCLSAKPFTNITEL